MARSKTSSSDLPLVLDFDGTLHKGDVTWEALAYTLRHAPGLLWPAAKAYMAKGRAAAKLVLQEGLRHRVTPKLAWYEDVVQLAKKAQAAGRKVLVATGSPQGWVEDMLRSEGLKFPVLGTTAEGVNLTRDNKTKALVDMFGLHKFDYAGNSADDLPVWAAARYAYVVHAPAAVEAKARAQGNVAAVMVAGGHPMQALLRSMRPHQWMKNLLVFVPLITAHQWANPTLWMLAALAFISFSLCASGVYVLNDVVDIQDDRAHPRKRLRPLAAGELSVPLALAAVPLLTVLAFGLAAVASPGLAVMLGVYLAVTLAYSFTLKTRPVADVVTLAGLYCLRVVAGGAATGIALSFWLLLVALLGFFSLASMKRVVELRAMVLAGKAHGSSRGYDVDDMPVVAAQGVSSGLLTVLVLALYVQSPAVAPLYQHPVVLGLLCPLAMWWLGRAWMIAWRGQMHDDPVVFAAKDKASWMTLVVALAVMVMAS